MTLLKRLMLFVFAPFAAISLRLERPRRAWRLARAARLIRIDSTNVLLGSLHVIGERRVAIGPGGFFYRDIHLETQQDGRIDIGERVVISSGTHIVSFFGIRIGNGVMIGEYASIRDANHRVDPRQGFRDSGHEGAPIEIGDNAWLGRGVCVLGGVSIGEGAIVGANSVVTRSIPPRVLAVGAPARVVRALGEKEAGPAAEATAGDASSAARAE